MKQQSIYIVLGLGVVAILGGAFLLNQPSPTAPEAAGEVAQNQQEHSGDTAMEAKNTSGVSYADKVKAYSPATLASSTENDGRAVVFFHAGWCPTCKESDAKFQANPEEIPEDVTILKADYDTEIDLKKKYNVVAQDTFVQVDANGDEVTKWNSGGQGIVALNSSIQ